MELIDKMTTITKTEAVIGDYVYVDGNSGFCQGGYEKIERIENRYNEKTGRAYKVVITCNDSEYLFDNGKCVKGPSAYSIISYARKA